MGDERGFAVKVSLTALNRSDKTRELTAEQFLIHRAAEGLEFEGSEISVAEFLPAEPTDLTVLVPLGERVTGEDLQLDIVDARKRVEQQHDVGMRQQLHNLKLAILETRILQHLLDRNLPLILNLYSFNQRKSNS